MPRVAEDSNVPGPIDDVSPAGKISFVSRDPALALLCVLGPEPPEIFQGFGGWEEVTRPLRRSFVRWAGPSAFGQTIQLLFDGWGDNRSVQSSLDTLLRMARPRADDPPPILTIAGPALILGGPGWVISELTFGDAIRDTKGALLRQVVTVSLLQKGTNDLIRIRGRGGTGQATHTVKKGETIQKIAAEKLGDASRWTDIAKLNGIRDPRSLQVGKILRIPPK